MEMVRWERRPELRRPLMVVAFEGWNDAGDASSIALGCLAEAWNAERFATIDSEELYELVVDSWRMAVPKKVWAEYQASQE